MCKYCIVTDMFDYNLNGNIKKEKAPPILKTSVLGHFNVQPNLFISLIRECLLEDIKRQATNTNAGYWQCPDNSVIQIYGEFGESNFYISFCFTFQLSYEKYISMETQAA